MKDPLTGTCMLIDTCVRWPRPVGTCVSMLRPVCGTASDTHSSHRGGPCSSRKLRRAGRRKEPLCVFVRACSTRIHTDTGRPTRRLQQVEEGRRTPRPGGPSHPKEASSVSDPCHRHRPPSGQQRVQAGTLVHVHAYYAMLSEQVADNT